MSRSEITIGLSVSLSGKFHLQGQQALQGARLWQSYMNAQGGIVVQNGEKRSVRLIWYDDRSQISGARKNVFRLLREDQIDILLGPYSSSLTMAVVEIAEEYKKVLWNHGGSSDEIFRHGRRYLVGMRARQVTTCERSRTGWLKSSRGSVEFVSCIQGEEHSDGRLRVGFWNRPWLRLASRSSLSQSTLPRKLRHHSWSLFDIDPEVVVLAVTFPDELGIMRTRQHWPRTVRVVAAVAAGIGDFSSELGQIADGVLGPSQWGPGVTLPNVTVRLRIGF